MKLSAVWSRWEFCPFAETVWKGKDEETEGEARDFFQLGVDCWVFIWQDHAVSVGYNCLLRVISREATVLFGEAGSSTNAPMGHNNKCGLSNYGKNNIFL